MLRLQIEAASNPEIAVALFISRKTAANHVANLIARMHAESRTAAVSIALHHDMA